MPFKDDIKKRVLLWCDRHCCLCKKPCGINIEVHHIIPESEGGSNKIDNAIPLCYDCHGKIENYNPSHPKGNKYRVAEIKARRNQIYEEFTRHLVPVIFYKITQEMGEKNFRKFPNVGFLLSHLSDSLPVSIRVIIKYFGQDGKLTNIKSEYYNGKKYWNLNPKFSISGNFDIPPVGIVNDEARIKLSVSIIDQYKREHFHLPSEYQFNKEGNFWYLEP